MRIARFFFPFHGVPFIHWVQLEMLCFIFETTQIKGSGWQVGWSKVCVTVRLYIYNLELYIYPCWPCSPEEPNLVFKKPFFNGFGFISRVMFEVKLTRILFNTLQIEEALAFTPSVKPLGLIDVNDCTTRNAWLIWVQTWPWLLM